MSAQPSESAIGNMVRRVLKIIREEYARSGLFLTDRGRGPRSSIFGKYNSKSRMLRNRKSVEIAVLRVGGGLHYFALVGKNPFRFMVF